MNWSEKILDKLFKLAESGASEELASLAEVSTKAAQELAEALSKKEAEERDVIRAALFCGYSETVGESLERLESGDYYTIPHVSDGAPNDETLGRALVEFYDLEETLEEAMERAFHYRPGSVGLWNYITIDAEKLGQDWRFSHNYYTGKTGFIYFED